MGDSSMTDTHSHTRTRRTHKKSRAGCFNCKQRRIKCDEHKPTCNNCQRFSISCDFSPKSAPTVPEQGDETAGNNPHTGLRKRGRPRKDWSAITQRSVSQTSGSRENSYEVSGTAMISSPHLTVEDLELLYYYMSDPILSQGDKVLWQEKVPRLAFANPCVLHVLLAAPAFYKMRRDPDRYEHFKKIADDHLAAGVRQATSLLPNLNRDNCSALYVAAILTCCCSFAQPSGPRHLLVVAGGYEVPWLSLFRGVRLIIESIGFEYIFSGILAPSPSQSPAPPPQSLLNECRSEFVP
ncbi:hypothetical protein M426DRAFT_324400 [Hypoxylon sp. CI-4A]|nr:hypothetical protein M426DRAFT_324400 [Hypoxylon sp. CI-4A]